MTGDGLQRFVDAQEAVYQTALAELRSGRKRGHWMWFVFPQLKGLGFSPTAAYSGLQDLDEARRYLLHALLGPRLHECTQALLAVEDRSISAILGHPDDLKFRSCMTLFAQLPAADPVFEQALERFCDGQVDPNTLILL